MAISLGEKLRQAREAKNLELREVADQTRIALNYLTAIEADDYRTLPGGVFNKGFVRSFARVVGIDEREALADYTNLMAAQGINTADENNLPRRPEVLINNSSGLSVLTWILVFFVLGLVSAGIYFGVQYLRNRANVAQALAAPTPTPSLAAAAEQNPTPAPTFEPLAPPSSLTVQIKALNQLVNVTATTDNARPTTFNLQPNETREFTAEQSLKFRYAKDLASQLQLTINNRPATVVQTNPARPNARSVEMEITRDNVNQFLQR